MKKENWIWMPHPAHFICSSDCQFVMATYVGKYIVSTVGEMIPDYRVRKIYAESQGIVIEGKGDEWDANYFKRFGYDDIGCGQTYESMVFEAEKVKGRCCPYKIIVTKEVDFEGYNNSIAAYKGHLKLCDKWSRK